MTPKLHRNGKPCCTCTHYQLLIYLFTEKREKIEKKVVNLYKEFEGKTFDYKILGRTC